MSSQAINACTCKRKINRRSFGAAQTTSIVILRTIFSEKGRHNQSSLLPHRTLHRSSICAVQACIIDFSDCIRNLFSDRSDYECLSQVAKTPFAIESLLLMINVCLLLGALRARRWRDKWWWMKKKLNETPTVKAFVEMFIRIVDEYQ